MKRNTVIYDFRRVLSTERPFPTLAIHRKCFEKVIGRDQRYTDSQASIESWRGIQNRHVQAIIDKHDGRADLIIILPFAVTAYYKDGHLR